MSFKNWLLENIISYKYIGPCDRLRHHNPVNDKNWHVMMQNKRMVSKEEFLKNVDISPLLDEDESVEDFLKNHSDAEFFFSFWGNKSSYFMATKGFEFIFVQHI